MIRKILIISTEFPPAPGGIGTHAYQLAKNLSEKGFKVHVMTEQNYAKDYEISAFNNKQNFDIIRLKPTPTLLLLLSKLFEIWKNIRINKYDIVIGTGKHASWFSYLCTRFTLSKCILIGHGTEFTIKMSKKSALINRLIYSKCEGLIFVSAFTCKKARENKIANKNSIVINNGADSTFSRLHISQIEKFRNELNLLGKKIILTIGNVTERKGQRQTISALPILLQRLPNVHYFCIGIPTIAEQLFNYAKTLGCEKHVHFIGRKSNVDLVKWLNLSDLFVMTSTMTADGDFEGFGIAVIEAALCGKASLVSNNSGLTEAVVNNETGIIINEKNPEEIANALYSLLSNQNELDRLGNNALKRAENELTWDKVVNNYIDYFNQILYKENKTLAKSV